MDHYFFTLICICLTVSTYGKNIQNFQFDNVTITSQLVNETTGIRLIEFTISANTSGWVGLGLSSQPNMTNADWVIGGVALNKDRSPISYHIDMYSKNGTIRLQDRKLQSDWILTETGFNESNENPLTMLTYRRPLKTDDTNEGQDYEIKAGEQLYLLWSYGERDDLSAEQVANGFSPKAVILVNNINNTNIKNDATGVNNSIAYILSSLLLAVIKIF